MFVRRVDVSLRVSIQRESWVTGAYAMSASFVGSGPGSTALRTKWSRVGCRGSPASVGPLAAETEIDDGCQRVAGASVGSSAIFFGPVRRSSNAAIEVRQLLAII